MMAHRPRQAWGLLVGIGLILYACTDAVLTPDDPTDATFGRVESSAASLSFGTGAGPTTFYCNVVTRQANGAFRHRTLRFVLPARFSTPGLESELRFFERRYSDGTPAQKAVCDLPVHGFAFAMVQARLHDGNRNRSVQPFSPWQRTLLGREVASLLERGEIQAAGFLSNFLSWAMQTYFVTERPDDMDCEGEWNEVQPGQIEGDYDYEGYWYCEGTIVLDGVETQELEGAPDVYYVWPEGEDPEPPPEPECCGGSGDPGDPPDDECDPELDTCDPCDPTDEICESAFDLSCNDAERGATVTCTITGETDEITAVEWHFTGDGLTADNIGTEPTWSGTAVVGGTVTATVSYGGGVDEAMLSADFSVTARSWSWDSSKRTFGQGSPGQVDNCFPPDDLGLTADVQGCTAADPILFNPGREKGFEISEGSGPNDGIWYVTNPTTRMDVRTQMARIYRSDAPKHSVQGTSQVVQGCTAAYSPNSVPPQNNDGINTSCFQIADFTALVNLIWTHEGDHLALIQGEAPKAEHDIYAKWEPIVEPDSVSAFNNANDIQNVMNNAIVTVANSIHNGCSSTFDIFYHIGGGIWDGATVIPTHC